MKVYVVVVNYHPANAPQNYETDCQIFLDKKQAEKYKEAKEKEFPISWGCPNCGCDQWLFLLRRSYLWNLQTL